MALTVQVEHRGVMRVLAVRDVVIDDEERIERLFPEPRPPIVEDEQRGRVPDFTDAEYLAESQRVVRTRAVARIGCALTGEDATGAEWLGETINQDITAKVARLKGILKSWQVNTLAAQLRDPQEVTEPGIQREAESLYPTSATVPPGAETATPAP